MYELLSEYIKPEMLILIPVLYAIGIGIKKSNIADKNIPWLLGVISVVLCAIYIIATEPVTGIQNIALAVFTAATQGILIAAASVYVNQVVKQAKEDNNNKEI